MRIFAAVLTFTFVGILVLVALTFPDYLQRIDRCEDMGGNWLTIGRDTGCFDSDGNPFMEFYLENKK